MPRNPIDDYNKLLDALRSDDTGRTPAPYDGRNRKPTKKANTRKPQTTVTRNAAAIQRAKKASASNQRARAQMSADREPNSKAARAGRRRAAARKTRPASKVSTTRKAISTRKGTTARRAPAKRKVVGRNPKSRARSTVSSATRKSDAQRRRKRAASRKAPAKKKRTTKKRPTGR